MFYGMPIHIIRDVAITIRSFYKRISDFIRYRQATKDMNIRYPDATADEIHREDVCIICREMMYSSQRLNEALDAQTSQGHLEVNDHGRNRPNTNGASVNRDERFRPKKLPCGHILHCACLRSWLERQQICPICRAPVIISNPITPRSRLDNITRNVRPQEDRPQANDQSQGQPPQPNVERNTFSFGPFRLSVGLRPGVAEGVNVDRANLNTPARAGIDLRQRRNSLERLRQASGVQGQASTNVSSSSPRGQLLQLERQLLQDIRSLGAHATQLFLVRVLEAELVRLRMEINHEAFAPAERVNLVQSFAIDPLQGSELHTSTQISASNFEEGNLEVIQQNLPNGLIIPHGWNIVLLRRIQNNEDEASAMTSSATASTVPFRTSAINSNLLSPFSPRPLILKSQIVEHQNASSEIDSNAERETKNMLDLSELTKLSTCYNDISSTKIQIVRLWNETKFERKKHE